MRFGIGIWLPSDTFKVIADWTERLVPAGGSIDTTLVDGMVAVDGAGEDDLKTRGLEVRGGLSDALLSQRSTARAPWGYQCSRT